jgi:hypothetical protein
MNIGIGENVSGLIRVYSVADDASCLVSCSYTINLHKMSVLPEYE